MKYASNITRDYRIKVRTSSNSRGYLVGLLGLIALVGEPMADKLCYRAKNSLLDKTVCRPRNVKGIVVTFYNK